MQKLAENLDKLRIFMVVANKGKINEASQVLNLTQPSISRAIQKLEQAFGSTLFLRSREGVKLTKAGQLLFEATGKILRDLEDVQAQAKYIEHDLKGHLLVGTYESLAEYLWPDFLIELAQIHPDFKLSIKTALNADAQADLLAGRINLLVDAEPRVAANLVSWPLYKDKFGFFISGTKKLHENFLDESISFVALARDQDRLTINDHLEKAGYDFTRVHTFDSFATVKQMAIKGMGLAVLPLRLAKEDERKKLIRRVHLKGISAEGFGVHTICATVTAENEKDFRIRKIVSLLKNHFK